MASAVIGSLRVTLGLDSAQFQDGLASAEKGAARLEKIVTKAAKAAAVAAGVAATAIGTAFAVGVGKAISRVEKMEAASRRLDTALTNTGNAANTSAKELASWAEDLERRTGRAAQEVMDIGANLATFGFGEETFLRSIELANDMAAAWGGDLRQNMEGLARALADPEKGLAMLSQRGITFTEDGKKMAIQLAKNGELIKAQAVLMEELEEQVKGVAEDGYAGLTKALGNLNMAYEALFDGIVEGSGVQDAMSASADGLTQIIEALDKEVAKFIPTLRRLSDAYVEAVTDQNNIETAVGVLTEVFVKLAGWVYEATVDIRNFVSETEAVWELVKNPLSTEAWDNYQRVVEANTTRLKEAQEEIQRTYQLMNLPAVMTGYGEDGNEGWSPVRPERTADGEGTAKGLTDKEMAKLEREREMLTRKLEQLKEFLMLEDEAEIMAHERRLAELQKMRDAEIISLEEHSRLKERLTKEHEDRLADIRRTAQHANLSAASNLLGALTDAMGREGDKQLGLVKALGIAEALINTYKGITAALADSTVPTFARFANAAAVAVAGFAQVQKIRATSKSGSGGGGAGGSGGSAPATTGGGAQESSGPSRELIVSGFRADELITGDVARSLMTKLVDMQGDGYKLVVV